MTQPIAPYLGGAPTLGGLSRVRAGKVRDVYELDSEHLLFVTTDRVSAFDVVMPQGIPHKGRVLTAIAAHWFETTRDVVDNHLVSTAVEEVAGLGRAERDALRGRVMIVHKAQVTPVEWVLRGYLAGSGWKEYKQRGSVCGVELPAGLQLCSRLPEPIVTPTTKSDVHDEPITPAQAREAVGAALFDKIEKASRALFRRGTEVLAREGILLADTKFEFGTSDGKLLLVDEALTPDSSRFWPAETWQPGSSPPSYDKQILRDWLETTDWNKQPPGPDLPLAIVERVAARYLEVCAKVTGGLPQGVSA